MDINNFSDLTGFIYSEYDKMADSFGISNPSKSFVKFTEKSLRKYAKLYNKPLLEQSKRDLQLKIALDTMPHGFLWKLFHQKLWQRCKAVLSELEQQKKEQAVQQKSQQLQKILVPEIVKPIEVLRVADPPNDSSV